MRDPATLPPVDPMVEGSLTWSMVAADDVAGLIELREAIDYFDDPVAAETDVQLRAQLADARSEPERNGVVGRDLAGTIVAYGWNHPSLDEDLNPRVWLDGGVHPAWRHQGIGHQLMMWQINRALVWDAEHRDEGWKDLWVGSYVDTKNASSVELMENADLVGERWFFDMVAPLSGGTPSVHLPEGIQLVGYCDELADCVRRAHNEAFSGEPGAHEVEAKDWAASLQRDAARPEWSWVAIRGNECVG